MAVGPLGAPDDLAVVVHPDRLDEAAERRDRRGRVGGRVEVGRLRVHADQDVAGLVDVPGVGGAVAAHVRDDLRHAVVPLIASSENDADRLASLLVVLPKSSTLPTTVPDSLTANGVARSAPSGSASVETVPPELTVTAFVGRVVHPDRGALVGDVAQVSGTEVLRRRPARRPAPGVAVVALADHDAAGVDRPGPVAVREPDGRSSWCGRRRTPRPARPARGRPRRRLVDPYPMPYGAPRARSR